MWRGRERGKPAERVGREAAEGLLRQLKTGNPVDIHTTDNLIIWCSHAKGESIFRTREMTMRTLTAIRLPEIIARARFEVEEVSGGRLLSGAGGSG